MWASPEADTPLAYQSVLLPRTLICALTYQTPAVYSQSRSKADGRSVCTRVPPTLRPPVTSGPGLLSQRGHQGINHSYPAHNQLGAHTLDPQTSTKLPISLMPPFQEHLALRSLTRCQSHWATFPSLYFLINKIVDSAIRVPFMNYLKK